MKKWSYQWLPIIFGCHCREDRSLHYKGKKFPICARCTGELVGILTALPMFLILKPKVLFSLLLMLPMLLDGFTQLFTKYESRNWIRVITGILFGIGLVGIIWIYLSFAYAIGVQTGMKMLN